MDFVVKPPERLEREDLIRQTLEAAAARIEREAGSLAYMQAWARAAKLIRSMMPK